MSEIDAAHYIDPDTHYGDYEIFLIEYHNDGAWRRYGQAFTLKAAQGAVGELSASAELPWRIIKKTVTYEPQKVRTDGEA